MERISDIANVFAFDGKLLSAAPYGDGHINDTYALVFDNGGVRKRYILQKMTKTVFPDIATRMENVARVTDFLAKEIKARGGDSERETLTLIRTKDGKTYYVDKDGE